ncbi:MAG TPA: hypothetical protein VNN55_08650 [bacterium]|nr:hypothetical protein [bacterium]
MKPITRVAPWGLAAVRTAFVLSPNASAGDRDHLNGFFLRLSAGVGAASTEIEAMNTKVKFSGPAGDLNFAIGAIVAPNLALHGTLFGWSMTNPDAEVGNAEGELDGDLTLGAVGVGLTYYLMPANVYLSGSVGLGSLTLEADDMDLESDNGVVIDLTIGKEWWVGRNWGLGVAGSLGLHSIPDPDVDENWSGPSVAVRFSATMN